MDLFDVQHSGGVITYQGESHEEIAVYHSVHYCKPGRRFFVTLLPDGPSKNFVAVLNISSGDPGAVEIDFAGPGPSLR